MQWPEKKKLSYSLGNKMKRPDQPQTLRNDCSMLKVIKRFLIIHAEGNEAERV